MSTLSLDHLVVTSPSLEAGIRFIGQALGVPMQEGGRHARMGTHSALLRLGDAQYLEVIVVDPDAPAPARPRWFGLDEAGAQATPHLAGWVARTGDLRKASSAVAHALGTPETMSRGDLAWQITIPADGSLPFEGVGPMLIEWTTPAHPAERLPPLGCSLLRIEAFHPRAAELDGLLRLLGFRDWSVQPGPVPVLLAHIQTPNGPRRLGLLGDNHG